jgi:hypothetical protein
MPALHRTLRSLGSDESVYLTDEVFLFRVAGLTGSPGWELVELEDCYGLDVVSVPMASLGARRLRIVTPHPPTVGLDPAQARDRPG